MGDLRCHEHIRTTGTQECIPCLLAERNTALSQIAALERVKKAAEQFEKVWKMGFTSRALYVEIEPIFAALEALREEEEGNG